MSSPLAATVPHGELRYLRLPRQLVLIARGDWERAEDSFSAILDEFGISDSHLAEKDWSYTWDETNDCDVWVIDLPEVAA
jgi:hypothetical protein